MKNKLSSIFTIYMNLIEPYIAFSIDNFFRFF